MITINNQLDDVISINDLVTAVRAIGDQSLKSNDGVKQAISDLNYKIVQPAIKEANQTAKQADKLVEQSKVHDDAIKAQDEALTEAKQGANDAMIRSKSAWDVATSATNAASSAQSDAKQATSSVAALLTSVDTLKGTVTGLQAESTMQASEIRNKVTRSDVTGMLTGYATQEYTQSLVTQKADEWNLNLIKLKNDTQTSVTNLAATVDGLQSTVKSKADSSTVTQLKNALQSKVESSAYTSAINQLSDDINLRVKSDELLSQINLEAGRTLIDSKKIVLNADSVIFSANSKAFIPSAAISEISSDKVYFEGTNGKRSYMSTQLGSLDPSAPANTLSTRFTDGYEVATSDGGSFLLMLQDGLRLAVRDDSMDAGNGTGKVFDGLWCENDGNYLITKGAGFHTGTVTVDGSKIGAWQMADGKNIGISTHGDRVIHIGEMSDPYGFGDLTWNNNTTNVELKVHGWAYVNDWIEAAGLGQHSALSLKTNVEKLDTAKALDWINHTDLTTFDYKRDLKAGINNKRIGPIIDDVNQVAQYQIADPFIAPQHGDTASRDDSNIVGALMGAVQELTKRLEKVEAKA